MINGIKAQEEIKAAFAGRTIKAVRAELGGTELWFDFADGGGAMFRVGADCCSESWIEHIEVPADIDGAVFVGCSEGGEVDAGGGHGEHCPEPQDVTLVYSASFATDRGHVVVEFRNTSNGYYGGDIGLVRVVPKVAP